MPRPRRQSELPGADALYERLFAEQDGVCAICGNPPKTRRLHVDHDHRTRRVRGLLCFRCNRFLPVWMTAHWLERAAEYLRDAALTPEERDELGRAEREILPSMSVVQREAAKGVPEHG